ncbi:hypothetical protein [Streptomyces sp. NRRL S-350]|uniref:hypothetical protein n=1 Tax=Streptomyces sp. NRRL S-350 TaxID=1463902 RepID=UPI0004C293A3|nr:hypothetical protein [Streptomyces sp. NRRL S-350]
MSDIRYPDCTVTLSGTDGNVYSILGAVRAQLRRHLSANGVGGPERAQIIAEFTNAVTSSGSYQEALNVVHDWVAVE